MFRTNNNIIIRSRCLIIFTALVICLNFFDGVYSDLFAQQCIYDGSGTTNCAGDPSQWPSPILTPNGSAVIQPGISAATAPIQTLNATPTDSMSLLQNGVIGVNASVAGANGVTGDNSTLTSASTAGNSGSAGPSVNLNLNINNSSNFILQTNNAVGVLAESQGGVGGNGGNGLFLIYPAGSGGGAGGGGGNVSLSINGT